jgi:hypothetical protein
MSSGRELDADWGKGGGRFGSGGGRQHGRGGYRRWRGRRRWRCGSLGRRGSRSGGRTTATEKRQHQQSTDDAKAKESARPRNSVNIHHDCSDLRQGISDRQAYYSTFAPIRPLSTSDGDFQSSAWEIGLTITLYQARISPFCHQGGHIRKCIGEIHSNLPWACFSYLCFSHFFSPSPGPLHPRWS